VQAASAHYHRDEADHAGALSLQDRPLNLVDIARVLGGSAGVDRLDDVPIRAWRDDLTVIRDALSYARGILAADVAILTEAGLPRVAERLEIVDHLPGVLVSRAPETERLEREASGFDPDIDEGLFVRTDHLLAPHREMARVDLSSLAARARVLEMVEEQLAMLTERQAAVEARLQQIRAVIIRRYRDAVVSAHDQTA
jgi:hypothetical protein